MNVEEYNLENMEIWKSKIENNFKVILHIFLNYFRKFMEKKV